jgi:hypothetical protein
MKKTWKFQFNNGVLDWIERLPVTEEVEGEEGAFILLVGERVRWAQERPVRQAIRAAMESRRRARGILGSGSGTYEDEGGDITIKFDPPSAETS